MKMVPVSFALVLMLCSCGDDNRPAPGPDTWNSYGDTSSSSNRAPQACEDFIYHAALMFDRCGVSSYEEARLGLQGELGLCLSFTGIRDEHEFSFECFPWLGYVDCSYVTSDGFQLDTSCQNQLLR